MSEVNPLTLRERREQFFDKLDCCQLSKRCRLVLRTIRWRSFDRGQPWAWIPSLNYFVEETRMNKADVSRTLAELEKRGIIQCYRSQGGERTGWYGINVEWSAWEVQEDKPSGAAEQLWNGLEEPEDDLAQMMRRSWVEFGEPHSSSRRPHVTQAFADVRSGRLTGSEVPASSDVHDDSREVAFPQSGSDAGRAPGAAPLGSPSLAGHGGVSSRNPDAGVCAGNREPEAGVCPGVGETPTVVNKSGSVRQSSVGETPTAAIRANVGAGAPGVVGKTPTLVVCKPPTVGVVSPLYPLPEGTTVTTEITCRNYAHRSEKGGTGGGRYRLFRKSPINAVDEAYAIRLIGELVGEGDVVRSRESWEKIVRTVQLDQIEQAVSVGKDMQRRGVAFKRNPAAWLMFELARRCDVPTWRRVHAGPEPV